MLIFAVGFVLGMLFCLVAGLYWAVSLDALGSRLREASGLAGKVRALSGGVQDSIRTQKRASEYYAELLARIAGQEERLATLETEWRREFLKKTRSNAMVDPSSLLREAVSGGSIHQQASLHLLPGSSGSAAGRNLGG